MHDKCVESFITVNENFFEQLENEIHDVETCKFVNGTEIHLGFWILPRNVKNVRNIQTYFGNVNKGE